MKAIVIAAPSGTGKTTVVNKLITHFPNFERVVSFTTRKPRDGEEDGIDYHFITPSEFDASLCFEFEKVYSNSVYGVYHSELERITSKDHIPIFIVDTKGAMKLKKIMGSDCLTVFLLPPNKQELISRLRNRQTEDEAAIAERIAKVDTEIKEGMELDYYIVNDELNKTVSELKHQIDKFLVSRTNKATKYPIVVNLFGTSGVGKSTTASDVFSALKKRGYRAELVTEFAKELTYEKNLGTLGNQIYVFGKQHHRMYMLIDQVDIIITDSPLPLCAVYCPIEQQSHLSPIIFFEFNRFNNINFLLERHYEYQTYGRNQTENESDEIGKEIVKMLDTNKIPYDKFVFPVEDSLPKIIKRIEKELKRKSES